MRVFFANAKNLGMPASQNNHSERNTAHRFGALPRSDAQEVMKFAQGLCDTGLNIIEVEQDRRFLLSFDAFLVHAWIAWEKDFFCIDDLPGSSLGDLPSASTETAREEGRNKSGRGASRAGTEGREPGPYSEVPVVIIPSMRPF